MPTSYNIYTGGSATPSTLPDGTSAPVIGTRDAYGTTTYNTPTVAPVTPTVTTPVAPTTPVAGTNPTDPTTQPSSYAYLNAGVNDPYNNANINAAGKTSADFAMNGLTPEEQAQTRSVFLNRMQSEVNSLNDVYAGKLSEAKIVGANKLGSTLAAEYRSGSASNNAGSAMYDTTTNANTASYNALENERASKVAAIQSAGYAAADRAVQDRTTARHGGLDANLKYVTSGNERAIKNTTEAASVLLSHNAKIEDIPANQLKEFAKNYGTTVEAIGNTYKTMAAAKVISDKKLADDEAKRKADLEKEANNRYAPGTIGEYQYAKEQGYKGSYSQYQNEDVNRKIVIPKVKGADKPYISGSATFTSQQISAGEQKLQNSKGTDGFVDPNIYQAAYNDWIQKGGVAKDFLTKYPPKNHVNPANTAVPAYLRPASGKSNKGRTV